jgi:hypothetical protein
MWGKSPPRSKACGFSATPSAGDNPRNAPKEIRKEIAPQFLKTFTFASRRISPHTGEFIW